MSTQTVDEAAEYVALTRRAAVAFRQMDTFRIELETGAIAEHAGMLERLADYIERLAGVGSSPATPELRAIEKDLLIGSHDCALQKVRELLTASSEDSSARSSGTLDAVLASSPAQPDTQREIERLQLELDKANGRYDECCKFRNKLIARLGARAQGLEVPE